MNGQKNNPSIFRRIFNKKIGKTLLLILFLALFLASLVSNYFILKFTGLSTCLSFKKTDKNQCKIIKRNFYKKNLFKMIRDNSSDIDDLDSRIQKLEDYLNY